MRDTYYCEQKVSGVLNLNCTHERHFCHVATSFIDIKHQFINMFLSVFVSNNKFYFCMLILLLLLKLEMLQKVFGDDTILKTRIQSSTICSWKTVNALKVNHAQVNHPSNFKRSFGFVVNRFQICSKHTHLIIIECVNKHSTNTVWQISYSLELVLCCFT